MKTRFIPGLVALAFCSIQAKSQDKHLFQGSGQEAFPITVEVDHPTASIQPTLWGQFLSITCADCQPGKMEKHWGMPSSNRTKKHGASMKLFSMQAEPMPVPR